MAYNEKVWVFETCFYFPKITNCCGKKETFQSPLVILNYTSVKAVQKNWNIPKETAFTVAVETVSAFI